MTALLITGIGELTTQAGAHAGDPENRTRDAALLIEDGRVVWVGTAEAAPSADERLDVEGRAVLPGWVDTHTHLVFAGDRSAEFEARMAGERYSAGGIATTMAATRAASEQELIANATRLRREAGGRAPPSWKPRPATGSMSRARRVRHGPHPPWPMSRRSSAHTWCRRASTAATTSTW